MNVVSGTRLVCAVPLTRPDYTRTTDRRPTYRKYRARTEHGVFIACDNTASDARHRSIERNVAPLTVIQTCVRFLDTTEANSRCVSSSSLDRFNCEFRFFPSSSFIIYTSNACRDDPVKLLCTYLCLRYRLIFILVKSID